MQNDILTTLERAELAARERSLAAAGEAEAIVTAARATANGILAGVDDRAAQLLAQRREALLAAARAEAAAIDAELDQPERLDTASQLRLADRIVRAVLAETEEA
ncbi:MAG: hypothetical protein FIA92_16500 [Chloroflexi bacterium]|nr:hypothetical protein [Chloroflexota bacterium]